MWTRMRFVVHTTKDYLEQRRPMMQWWANFVKVADRGSSIEDGYKGIKLIAMA